MTTELSTSVLTKEHDTIGHVFLDRIAFLIAQAQAGQLDINTYQVSKNEYMGETIVVDLPDDLQLYIKLSKR